MLQLNRDVADAVLVVGDVLYLSTDHFTTPLVVGVDQYVRGESLASRRYGPDVDVVYEGHALYFFYACNGKLRYSWVVDLNSAEVR